MTMLMNVIGPERRLAWLGTQYALAVGHAESGGLIGAFESTVPAWGGPPIHIHSHEDEVILVLAERYEFWLDGAIMARQPGEAIFLPRGVPHTFRVASDRPGRNLTLYTPAGLEGFFVEAARRDLAIPTDLNALAELGGRFGLAFRGPADWGD